MGWNKLKWIEIGLAFRELDWNSDLGLELVLG